MTDVVIEMAWSDVHSGLRIRLEHDIIRRGTIKAVKGRALVVRFDDHRVDTTIPEAKWYFTRWKMGDRRQYLVVIAPTDDDPDPDLPPLGPPVKLTRKGTARKTRAPRSYPVTDTGPIEDPITPAEASELLGIDQRVLRRRLRAGLMPGQQVGGRWVLSRSAVEAQR